MEIEQCFYNTLMNLGVLPCQSVLEVGCGEGRAAGYVYHSCDNLCLLDISEKNIKRVCKKFNHNKNIRVYNHDIFHMSGKFDLIYYFLSLHHIDNPIAQLNRVRSLLNSNGKLIICEFYSEEGELFHILDNVFKDAYTPEELRYLLMETGFRIKSEKEVGVIYHATSLFFVYLMEAIL